MTTVLVIGNGKSRKGMDLKSFDCDISIGANKLYEEFRSTHLIVWDKPAIQEATNHKKFFSTWAGWMIIPRDEEMRVKNPHDPIGASNSGELALRLCVTTFKATTVKIVGFDSMLADKEQHGSNLYHQGTGSDGGQRVDFMQRFLGQFEGHVEFIFPAGQMVHPKLQRFITKVRSGSDTTAFIREAGKEPREETMIVDVKPLAGDLWKYPLLDGEPLAFEKVPKAKYANLVPNAHPAW